MKNVMKRLFFFQMVFLLFLIFLFPVHAQAQKSSKSKSIYIHQVSKSVCQQIHKELMKENSIVLKIKGSKNTTKKKIIQTVAAVKKVNKQGICFQYGKGEKQGNYYRYIVTADSAKVYKYGVKFVSKIYRMTKNISWNRKKINCY